MDIERMEVVKIEEGDTVVLHVPRVIDLYQRAQIVDWVRTAVGPKPKIVIVDGGTKLEVLKPAKGTRA